MFLVAAIIVVKSVADRVLHVNYVTMQDTCKPNSATISPCSWVS